MLACSIAQVMLHPLRFNSGGRTLEGPAGPSPMAAMGPHERTASSNALRTATCATNLAGQAPRGRLLRDGAKVARERQVRARGATSHQLHHDTVFFEGNGHDAAAHLALAADFGERSRRPAYNGCTMGCLGALEYLGASFTSASATCPQRQRRGCLP